jgi:hypothetical protein
MDRAENDPDAAEPDRRTTSDPRAAIVAVTPCRGALASQPEAVFAIPDTSGAVPRPIGPGPKKRWMALSRLVGMPPLALARGMLSDGSVWDGR